MPVLQLILTLIFYLWLFLMMALLWQIWRDGTLRLEKLQQALIDVAMKNAEMAKNLSIREAKTAEASNGGN